MSHFRSVRVTTLPIAVRVAGLNGRLVNLSATGALVQIEESLAKDRECPIYLTLETEPITLRGRVVRSEAVPVHMTGATWERKEYAVAFAFTESPRGADEALRALCGDQFDKRE
jgi:hypothetical protein